MPDEFEDHRGRPINAVVGFAGTLARLVAAARPQGVVVAFDESLHSGFRHRLDAGYKANRALPDERLAFQLRAARELVERLGIQAIASSEYEADDLLASVAARVRAGGGISVLASEDKDLAQVLAGEDLLWQFARRRVLDAAAVTSWLGVPPDRLAERQALTGDAVDGIPGVTGIGARTAAILLAHCAHLDELLADPQRVAGMPVRGAAGVAGRLAASVDRVRLNLQLTALAAGIHGLPAPDALRYRPPTRAQVADTVAALALPRATGQHLARLCAGDEQ